MKDIRYLTDEERTKIFRLLKPIGYKEGDELHTCEILTNGELEPLIEVSPETTGQVLHP